MKNLNTNQINEPTENNVITTPARQSHSSKLNIEAIDLLSSVNTPKGTKIHHPFFQTIFTNIDKEFTSPDMFNLNREYPHRDSNTLSPDVVGALFPKEINTNVDFQHQFEEKLYKTHQSYFDKKSSQFFNDHLIKPSPEPQDSGIGVSLHTTESNESDNILMSGNSMFLYETPPSKFKWNRAEYRNRKSRSSVLDKSYMSFEENEDQSNITNPPYTLESTQLDPNIAPLVNNQSMMQYSLIGSPMFCDDAASGSQMRNFLRSSPHEKFNSDVMNGLNISPIKHDCGEETETDEELL